MQKLILKNIRKINFKFLETNCHIEDNDKLLNYDNCMNSKWIKDFFFVGNSHNDSYENNFY